MPHDKTYYVLVVSPETGRKTIDFITEDLAKATNYAESHFGEVIPGI